MDDETFTTLTSTIHNNPKGMTLIDYLCQRFKYKNHEAWVEAITDGSVLVNGKATSPSQALNIKDCVSYTSQRNEPAVATDITIIFEDDHLLVVNKPAPLLTHSSGIFINNTMIAMLRARTGNKDLSLGHRLDRETTGIVVLSKTRGLTAKLMDSLAKVDVEKHYLAVARGEVDFEEKLISGWMGKKSSSLIHIRQELLDSPTEGYKESCTRFLLKQRLKGFSLLACELKTGRTNQIRVHLEAAGHPIAGDKLYGRPDGDFLSYQEYFKKHLDFSGGGTWEHPRQLLHAWRLSMNHPVTNERLQWEAPIPMDMKKFIEEHIASI